MRWIGKHSSKWRQPIGIRSIGSDARWICRPERGQLLKSASRRTVSLSKSAAARSSLALPRLTRQALSRLLTLSERTIRCPYRAVLPV